MLKIQLFGHLQAQRYGLVLPDIRLNGANRLLALMVLQANRPVRNSWIAETLWPTTLSLDSVRKASQQLRKALDAEACRLRSENGFLRLDLSGLEIDVVRFDACLAQGDYQSYRQAVDLYNAPLLQGWDDPWALLERETRSKQYRHLVVRLVATLTKQEQFAVAAQLLSKAISIYPMYEDWWAQLMTAQARSGERLQALATGQNYLAYLQQTNREEGLRIQPAPVIIKIMQKLQLVAGPIFPETTLDLRAYEAVGGASPLDSQFYVERPEDQATHFAIGQRDSFVLIKGARQTGKSSLLGRAVHRARQNGATVLVSDWQQLRDPDVSDIAAFYRVQAANLARQLQLKIDLAEALPSGCAPSSDFEWFLREHIFAAVDTPILWAVDNADRLFSCPFRDDVFALFRSWHNERADDVAGPWHRFTMALAYTAEAHLAIRNLHQSPFNVGTRVTLGDFTHSQLCALNARYGMPLGDADVSRLYALVGGHPYLVRRALHEITARQSTLDEVIATAERNGGIFADHLSRLLDAVKADADLATNLRRILAGEDWSEESSARLCAAGLLVDDVADGLRPRCRLYDQFLRRRLS
jgi:DNA-binding SARP family transcriptional activator